MRPTLTEEHIKVLDFANSGTLSVERVDRMTCLAGAFGARMQEAYTDMRNIGAIHEDTSSGEARITPLGMLMRDYTQAGWGVPVGAVPLIERQEKWLDR